MIEVKCTGCFTLLTKPGGLLFGPPNTKGMVQKDHLCVTCYDNLCVILLSPCKKSKSSERL